VIERLVTSGQFTLDGGTWDVDNNVWLVGDDSEVLVIDAAHDADAILRAVGDRRLVAIVSTHAHNDHVNAATAVADAAGAPILLHPADRPLWDMVHPDRAPDRDLADGDELSVAGTALRVLHTPGHAPGAVCLYAPELGTIIDSIRDRLLSLPPETVVRTGHGDATEIGTEVPHLEEWIARGH
jgi:glyoxylase-like metal-dependent hydrolase (beta-lactamase superfamily II)